MISTLTKKHDFDIVFDGQKVYRLILDAMSNPARVVDIMECACKLNGGHAAFLAVAMTLLDNEVRFNTCGNGTLAGDISSLTLAKIDVAENADFIFVEDADDIGGAVEKAKCGTLSDPHKSATVVIQNDGAASETLTFSGPGIDGQIDMRVTRAVIDAVKTRDAQNYEYPQGIDFIFVSSDGRLTAIPRLVRAREE